MFNYKINNIPYDFKFLYEVLGYNFKCAEMNAAFGLVQLERFNSFKSIRRTNIQRYLNNLSNDIQTRVTFAGNITRHPAYREYLETFPNADTIMRNGFLLGAHHGMCLEDVDYVCNKIMEFFEDQ